MPASLTCKQQPVPNAPQAVRMLTSLLLLFPGIGSARLVQGQSVLVLEFYSRRLLTDAQFQRFAAEVRQAFAIWEMIHVESGHLISCYRASVRNLAGVATADKNASQGDFASQGELSPRQLPPEDANQSSKQAVLSSSEAVDLALDDGEENDPHFDACEVDRTVLERLRPRDFKEYWHGLSEAVECVAVELKVALLTKEAIETLVSLVADSWKTRLVVGVNVGIDEERLLLESDSFMSCLEAVKQELVYNGSAEGTADLLAYRDEIRVVVCAERIGQMTPEPESPGTA